MAQVIRNYERAFAERDGEVFHRLIFFRQHTEGHRGGRPVQLGEHPCRARMRLYDQVLRAQ